MVLPYLRLAILVIPQWQGGLEPSAQMTVVLPDGPFGTTTVELVGGDGQLQLQLARPKQSGSRTRADKAAFRIFGALPINFIRALLSVAT